jgi:hypothetical protein
MYTKIFENEKKSKKKKTYNNLYFLDFNMNGFATLAVLACAIASTTATFDATTGTFTLGALTLNSGNSLALTAGSTTAFLTSAGIVAGGLAILGLAIVKSAIISGEPIQFRQKRSSPVEQLAAIDKYFETITAMDVDDCGKMLVCSLETVPREERTPEENMIATLFGESSTIDPASAKAEYDLAAYLGQATGSKVACARRYTRCPLDRKTISQALAKMARLPAQ